MSIALSNTETATLLQSDVLLAVQAYITSNGGTIGTNFNAVLLTNTLANPNASTPVITATWTNP